MAVSYRNFDAPITQMEEDVKDEKGKPVTQKGLIYIQLMGFQGDANPDKKMAMFRLANKISKGGDIEINTDESGLIKEAIHQLPPISYGQISESLDNVIVKPKK